MFCIKKANEITWNTKTMTQLCNYIKGSKLKILDISVWIFLFGLPHMIVNHWFLSLR
jgi:hypothetical protein